MLEATKVGGSSPESSSTLRRKSMDPVSQHIRLEELPSPGGRFQIQNLLGTGTCAKVYSAFDKQKGNHVAVKIVPNIAENLLEIESEYRVLTSVGGQSIIPEFQGAYLQTTQGDKKELWFVTELCSGVPVSDLLKWLQREERLLREEEIAALIKTFMRGIHHLHENEIIHRDIRASNFILSPEGNVKMIDFGSCALVKETDGKAHSSVGTPYWMAPEVIACEQLVPYTKSCDVWSLGITAIELAELTPPLGDIHPVRAMFQVARNPPPTLKKISEWSEIFKDFINECLVRNPDHRPCVVELILHPFIGAIEDNPRQKVSVEEYLLQPFCPSLGEKEGRILKKLGQLVKDHLYTLVPYVSPTMTVKNGHVKKDPDSPFVRLLPDDLAATENSSEENVLDTLYHRYLRDDIYIYVGDILIGINPQKALPLYSLKNHVGYWEKARSDNPPHVFAVADRAYQQMLHHKRSQVIILFGKCNSGKSFSAAHLINHLAFLGPSHNPGMADKIQQLCPLLDAFGSAFTLTNPDSSRFLKTITVSFTKAGKITGGMLSAMLLDKARISCIPKDEGNFYILYYIYEGLKEEERLEEFGLDGVTSYRLLPKIKSKSIDMLVQGYKTVLRALKTLAFTEEEVLTVQRFASAILILGDMMFASKGSCIVPSNSNQMQSVAKSLSVESADLEAEICKGNNIQEVESIRDSFIQFLYLKIFEWIVSTVNKQLSFSRLVLGSCFSVSVIDPPGFEDTEHNGLFHLCANTINDFLQNYIQQLMFFKELEEYKEESVAIPFKYEEALPHTQLIHSLLNDKQGLLAALNRASHSNEDGNINWKEELQSSAKEPRVKVHEDEILIHHIFGEAAYKGQDLIRQNLHKPQSHFNPVLQNSKNSIISHIGSRSLRHYVPQKEADAVEGHVAVCEELKSLLPHLLQFITEDFPHLVVNLCPSKQSEDTKFDMDHVTQQLRSFNLMEIIMIRQQGFARRLTFSEFLDRYKYLAFDFDEQVETTKDNCKLLLIRLKMDGWEMGENKVFLKYYAEEYLSRLYETHVKKIIKVQAMARRFLVKTCQRKRS